MTSKLTTPNPRIHRTMNPHKLIRCALILSVVTLLWTTGCAPESESSSTEATQDPLETGISELRAFNFNQAHAILLEHAQHISPEDLDWPLATYSLALATWHQAPSTQQGIDDAKVLFHALVEKAPQHNLAASALIDLGRIAEFSQADDAAAQAQAYYKRVQDKFPGTEMAVRASLLEAQSLARSFDEQQVKQAIQLLEKLTKEQAGSQWIGTIEQYIAHLYAFYLDELEPAITHYSAAKEFGFPRSSDTDLSLWQLGLWQQEAKQDLAAAETFTELVEEHPRSVYGSVARKRIIEIAKQHPEANITIPELAEVRLGR